MKTFALCMGCGVAAFLFMGFQGSFFSPSRDDDDSPEAPAKPAPAVRLRFPDDLVPAVHRKPVPGAAQYDRTAKGHRLAFFRDGKLHRQWQDLLKDEWRAESVEKTELVVVLGQDVKTFLSITHYPNGAPPITRYRYDLKVSVVEAKTGTVLAEQRFASEPRSIRPVEDWGLMTIGQPVSFTTVYNWVASRSLAGFGGVATARNSQ